MKNVPDRRWGRHGDNTEPVKPSLDPVAGGPRGNPLWTRLTAFPSCSAPQTVPNEPLLVGSQHLGHAPGCHGQIGDSQDRPFHVTNMPHKVASLPRQSQGIYE